MSSSSTTEALDQPPPGTEPGAAEAAPPAGPVASFEDSVLEPTTVSALPRREHSLPLPEAGAVLDRPPPPPLPPPDPPPPDPPPLPADNAVGAFLDDEVLRLERRIAQALVVAAVVLLALSGYVAWAISRPAGIGLMVLTLAPLLWWAWLAQRLQRSTSSFAVRWVNPMLEISIPTIIFVIDFAAEGGLYATTSPSVLLYGMFTMLSVLRLRPYLPALVGLVGAVQYGLAFWLLVRPSAEGVAALALREDLMAIRCLFIALPGLVASALTAGLREAVSEASRQQRSNELFGKYRLQQRIAVGGMGEVYRAIYCPEGGFKRPVAIKRIHPHLTADARFIHAFRNEAQLSARLNHANIVQALDFGRVGDSYFFAMEFVEGLTLADVLWRAERAGRALPPRLAAWLTREICRALDYAHCVAHDDHGRPLCVIHRDLSPPNVMLSSAGQVKILDYGVAHALGREQLTHTHTVVGKLGYMAPEQYRGQTLDARVDLFAAAVISWEAVCGRHLFKGNTDADTLYNLLYRKVPSPRDARPGLGDTWVDLLGRGLQRDPASRFQSAAEMIKALDGILDAEGMPRPDEFAQFIATLPAVPRPVQNETAPG